MLWAPFVSITKCFYGRRFVAFPWTLTLESYRWRGKVLAVSAIAPAIPNFASMFNFAWALMGVSSGDTEIDVQIRCPETSR